MRLMRYKTKAECAPGKNPVVADALRIRSQIQMNPSSTDAEDVELHMHMVESNLPTSPQKLAELRSS